MGSFICRQPNGLLCRFSTVVDTVTDYNMTDEEYIQMYILNRITTARAEAEDVIKNRLKPFEWIDEYFVDNNMTEEEFEQIKAKMYENNTQKSEDNKQSRCNNCPNNTDELSGECYECVKGIEDRYEPIAELKGEYIKKQNTGCWIFDETDNSITCNKCGCLIWANDISNGEAHYCPNCGANMNGSSKSLF